MDKKGLLICGRYCAAPNFFGYCGPKKTSNLIDHLEENIVDKELGQILSHFETLYPYLQLIAKENNIKDLFDQQVVEAYWVGNNLLKNIKSGDYLHFLQEKILIEKKIEKKSLEKIKLKISTDQFLPHHNFHVFNIFKRMSRDLKFDTLKTMDECRIGFGKIISERTIVQYKPLVYAKNKLSFGLYTIKSLTVDYKGKQFIKNIKIGEWVSFHWGFVCDILTDRQVKNLEFYTQKAIDFYNATV